MTKYRLIFSGERDTAKHKFARRGVTCGAAGLNGGSSSRRRRRFSSRSLSLSDLISSVPHSSYRFRGEGKGGYIRSTETGGKYGCSSISQSATAFASGDEGKPFHNTASLSNFTKTLYRVNFPLFSSHFDDLWNRVHKLPFYIDFKLLYVVSDGTVNKGY